MSVVNVNEDKRNSSRKDSLSGSVYGSNSRLNLLQKRKKLDPMSGGRGVSNVAQRVLSAKAQRVKQLQSQLNEAHYHLQELSNENRILRAMQKKQEIALQRYENSNAELPQVLNSHSEELRVQQTKLKQLKQQFKEVSQKLKERDTQFRHLKDEHERLLELTKDKNLPERQKLQTQVSELSLKVQQQNDTINTLQRRIQLEAKNFRVQLQNEIMKHKDTRHDLDLAISNADKLSTIIELKEKMLSTAAGRNNQPAKSSTSTINVTMSKKTVKTEVRESRSSCDEKDIVDYSLASRMCENSRTLASALSHDEEVSSMAEPRSKFTRSRSSLSTNSRSTPAPTRKSSKNSDEIIDITKTVQEGMAGLAVYEKDAGYEEEETSPEGKKIKVMKAELMSKIINDEPVEHTPHVANSKLLEDSEEESADEYKEIERPKSRGRRHSAVSFYDDDNHKIDEGKNKKEKSAVERKLSGQSVDKYCKDMIQTIEKSSNVINRHIKDFNNSRIVSDKLMQQLEAVDKISEYVNMSGSDIPDEAFAELNNNFKALTEQVVETVPRRRAISGRGSAKTEIRTNVFGDSSMSNQDLLNDLLGKN